MVLRRHLWFIATLVFILGCQGERRRSVSQETITIRGSDSMVNRVQAWAEMFMEAHPEYRVEVSGGGSSSGIAALINGTADIATSSRSLRIEERWLLANRRMQEATTIPVAEDTIAIYVHPSNPLQEISLEHLRDIFSGTMSNWSTLGLNPAPIVLYTRQNGSGTLERFRKNVLDTQNFPPHSQTLTGTAALVDAIKYDRHGIAFGANVESKSVKKLRVRTNDIARLKRPLFLVSTTAASPRIQRFVDFVLNDVRNQVRQ